MAIDYLGISNAIAGKVSATGYFLSVTKHDWRSAPSEPGLVAAVIGQNITPLLSSGLASVSMRLEVIVRILLKPGEPEDLIDFALLGGADAVMGAMISDSKIGITDGSVRCVDVLGSDGEPLRAECGWVDIGQTQYRMCDVFIPILLNDVWNEG